MEKDSQEQIGRTMRMSLVFIGTTGAGPIYSYEIARALAADGRCQLQVIISENVENLSTWQKTFGEGTVDFHVVKTYKRSHLSVFLNTFNIVRKHHICRIIKAFNPDVLYSPFALIWERYLFGMLHGKVHIVKTIHDVRLHDSYKNIGDFMTKVLTWGSMHFVDSIVLLNHKDLQTVEQRYHRPCVVIPHASMNYYATDVPTTDDHLQKCIGFIGRIEPYKGLDLLVDAFERLNTKGLKLIIAGKGQIDEELRKRIIEHPDIELINRYIKDDEFAPLLRRVDFVVLPYKRASQSGVIPLCFALGKTVIATNVGALSEQVPEGTGMLVQPTAESIATATDYLYTHPETISQYGKAAYSYATNYLTWESSVDLLLNHLAIMQKK